MDGLNAYYGVFAGYGIKAPPQGIEKVVIDIDPNAHHDPELVIRAKYRKQ